MGNSAGTESRLTRLAGTRGGQEGVMAGGTPEVVLGGAEGSALA